MDRQGNKTKNKILENIRALYIDYVDYYERIKTKGAFNDNHSKLESYGNKYKNISPAGYLNKNQLHLKYLIDNLKFTRKIYLSIKIIFRSSKDNGGENETF